MCFVPFLVLRGMLFQCLCKNLCSIAATVLLLELNSAVNLLDAVYRTLLAALRRHGPWTAACIHTLTGLVQGLVTRFLSIFACFVTIYFSVALLSVRGGSTTAVQSLASNVARLCEELCSDKAVAGTAFPALPT